jgi:hypothetical protein
MKSRIVWMAVAVATAACSEMTDPTRPPKSLSPADKRAATDITFTVLPSLGGSLSAAYAINDQSEIVGVSTTLSGQSHAVRWTQQPGGAWEITTISGPGGSAKALNELGNAVGALGGRAKLWPRAGGEDDLGPGFATGINSAGMIVGVRTDVSPSRAVAWIGGGTSWTAHDLRPIAGVDPALPHYEEPRAVNDAAVIVGFAHDNARKQFAVHWDTDGSPNVWSQAVLFSLASGFGQGTAEGMDGNTVVGGAFCADLSCGVAYAWSLGGIVEPGQLTTKGSVAQGSNRNQEIVGFLTARQGTRAFITSTAGRSLRELGATGPYVVNTMAYDINNRTSTRSAAQAVGEGLSSTGVRVALVWTIP